MVVQFDRFPPPVPLFVKRYQFPASLQLKDRLLENVEVVLDLDPLGRHTPQGCFLGNSALAKAIENLADPQRLPRKVTLLSKEPGFSALIDVRSLHRVLGEPSPTGAIGDFECRHVTHEQNYEGAEPAWREVCFFLAGPRRDWMCSYSHGTSYTGESKVEVYDPELPLDIDLPFKVEVRPHFFHSEMPVEKHGVTATVVSLVIHTDKPRSELSDDDLVLEATGVADDCCLLVSFLSGARVAWYEHVLATADRLVRHARPAPPAPPFEPEMEDSPVRYEKKRSFLKTGIRRLRALREEQADPHIAIAYTISGRQAASLEETFTHYFFALEMLKDFYIRSEGQEKILHAKAFAVVRSTVKAAIQTLAETKPDLGLAPAMHVIEKKLSELNRPPLWESLQGLLKKHGVEWKDIYPDAPGLPAPRFISLRNRLVHTGTTASPHELWFETIRLGGVVERLLLAMLGWTDFVYAPRPWLHMLLRAKMGTETDLKLFE